MSDSSAGKDARQLFDLYHRAGVREYWLVDARSDDLVFRIHRAAPTGFEAALPGPGRFVASAVLRRSFRLVRRERMPGLAVFRLEQGPAES